MRLSPFSRLFLHFGGRLAPAFPTFCQKCSFIFRMVVVYWSWNCESCPEIKYFSLFLRTALLFQLIPARGRKLFLQAVRLDLQTFQLIPARGRKHLACIIVVDTHEFQLIPARGRKRFFCIPSSAVLLFQLIPARGRKPIQAGEDFTPIRDFNLSPQGDENAIFQMCLLQSFIIFQLIPVRGRKHRGGQERALTILFQLIPARERKHKEDDSGFYFAELFQLIPARGRKRIASR